MNRARRLRRGKKKKKKNQEMIEESALRIGVIVTKREEG